MASKARTLPLIVTLIFAACVCALLGAFANIAFSLYGTRDTRTAVENSWRLVSDIRVVRESALEAGLDQRHYLITGNPADLESYRMDNKRAVALMSGLAQRLAGNPVQVQYVDGLRELMQRMLEGLDARALAYERDGRDAALEAARNDPGDRRTMKGIRATTDAMIREAEHVLEERTESAARSYWLTVGTAMAVNMLAILVLTLFYSMTRRHFDRWISAEDVLQRHNENLETVVAARTKQLSQLSRHLIRVTDNEKARLARELHDELGSNLTAVNLDVAAVEDKLKTTEPAHAVRLRRALDSLRTVVGLSRRVIEDLRPSALDNMELSEALRGYCEEFTQRSGLECVPDLDEELGKHDPDWSIALFRVAQESLTNAAKYAKASQVVLSLKREDKGIRLRIADDGIGIPENAMDEPKAHGLLGMRERISMIGGTFEIGRGRGGIGTVVDAFVPFA